MAVKTTTRLPIKIVVYNLPNKNRAAGYQQKMTPNQTYRIGLTHRTPATPRTLKCCATSPLLDNKCANDFSFIDQVRFDIKVVIYNITTRGDAYRGKHKNNKIE